MTAHPKLDEQVNSMRTRTVVEQYSHLIRYSDKYYDDDYEYRHVYIPHEMVRLMENVHSTEALMSEPQWRGFGIQQSVGWRHYMWHKPDPATLLFRRPIDK